jgi:response regulator RpfG family c-di-GMP phosphodiesterase
MAQEQTESEAFSFAVEPAATSAAPAAPWKILIVDDEEEVHRVTQLALSSYEVLGRPLRLISAYSGAEAVAAMRSDPGIALVLMDVVMETEHAGLHAVQTIRNELNNRLVRIVLRTGQPGQAPERDVVCNYDINDYKEKTELTATKLFTVMQTGLRLYRELEASERMRRGLEQVIASSAELAAQKSLVSFQRGVLEQIAAVLYARQDALIASAEPGANAVAAELTDSGLRVVAGIGTYREAEGRLAHEVLDAPTVARLNAARDRGSLDVGQHDLVARFTTRQGAVHLIFLRSESLFTAADGRLLELFCRNIGAALDSLLLSEDLIDSQRRMILQLSATIEERSPFLNNHVRRVAAFAKLIGRKIGLSESALEELGVAAAMHDLGKIGIPDAILDKPGQFTAEERAIMETHVAKGERLVAGQKGKLMEVTAKVIGGHHERWDGTGYPRRIKGEENPLFARITGVADVFDALATRRVYKEPWPIEKVVDYFRNQRGKQFDPRLVDVLLENLDEIFQIQATLPADV